MRRSLLLILCVFLPVAILSAAGGEVPVRKMAVERLPDLNTPRSSHTMVLSPGGGPVVFGGHTTGFVPTQTAEYFEGGTWHEIEMLYCHDSGFFVPLRDGRVLLGGGAAEPFGIGQNWGTELYDPASHTFQAMPTLDRKRALANAAELEDGSVVVSGNWYADDAIEIIRPGGQFEYAGEVSEHRVRPYIIPTGPSDALVFGSFGVRNDTLHVRVDRLRGGPMDVPLLAEWRPVLLGEGFDARSGRIGDTTAGDYSYLVLGKRKDGKYALILMHGDEFSLLPLAADIPVEGLEGRIDYFGPVLADRNSRQAWVVGLEEPLTGRVCLLRIGYGEALDGGEAPVVLYYSDPLEEKYNPGGVLLLPDGTFLATGGMPRDNFNPLSSVYRFLPEGGEPWMPVKTSRLPWLLGLLCGILTGCAAVYAGWWIRRRKLPPSEPGHPEPADGSPSDDALFARINALMEERQLYRQKGLSLADIAQQLGSNTKYVSASINSRSGGSFTDFVNGFRVRHAQELLRADPGRSLSEVSEESGFSSESAFFRNFKAITGKTPSQWIAEP